MRSARSGGRGSLATFVPTIRARSIARSTIESDLRFAIDRDQLEL